MTHSSLAPSRALLTRLAAVLLSCLVLLAGSMAGAGFASAHAARIASDPAEDAVLTSSPSRVSATFNEAMQPAFAAMTVVGPDNNLWSTGEPRVDGAVVSVAVRSLGPAGVYTANYRVTSADGHPVSGKWSFRLTVPSTGTPGPAAADVASPASPESHDEGIPAWPFVVAAVLIVVPAAWWVVRRRA